MAHSLQQNCSLGSDSAGVPGETPFSEVNDSSMHVHYISPSLVTLLCSISIILLVHRLTWKRISNLFWNSMMISVTVSGKISGCGQNERLYSWVLDWFAKNLKDLPHSISKATREQEEYGKIVERVISLPGYGVLVHFQYKGQWIQFEGVWEKKIVFTSYRHQRALIYQFLEECKPVTTDTEGDVRIIIYGVSELHELPYWDEIGHPKKRRSLSSVILSKDTKANLMSDVRDFKTSEQWYVDRGIPYRRAYILYGPPGCGKSSFIKSIAGEIGFDICILSLTAKGLTDDNLNELMNTTPEDCIILLEDVDAAFRSWEDTSATNREQNLSFEGRTPSTVTFGGLLNALDGVASTEGRIVFMTTNHIERLDAAMVRPGRVDMKFLVDYPNDDQLAAIFGRFYQGSGEDLKKEFVKRIRGLGTSISMAACQGLFMFHKQSGQEAIDHIKNYFNEQIVIAGSAEDRKKKSLDFYC